LNTPRAPSGNAFSARFEELSPDVHGDAQVASLIDAYDARVNEHNRTALANVLPPPSAAGSAHYLGSASCRGCHEPAFAWWTRHAHGRAYTTLERQNKQFNLSCVGCHVTGYMQPGGSSVVHNQGLTHVGCESCHGAGSEHVAQHQRGRAAAAGSSKASLVRSPSEAACKQCHTPEHSDLFEYTGYVARLRAPGHGLPPPALN
jgi:hypothetical protein